MHTLGLGVLPPIGPTANILVRCAHCQRSQTFLHAALSSIGAGRQSAVKVGHRALTALAISVAAGTGADVMAGGAGAAGPTPDVRHQPQGYPNLLPYNTGYPGLSRLIPHRGLSRDIPG